MSFKIVLRMEKSWETLYECFRRFPATQKDKHWYKMKCK